MALLLESNVRAKARAAGLFKSLTVVLNERVAGQAKRSGHDVFLSHAFDDRELVLGVAMTLEEYGYSVYLDWRDDPSLDRKNVSPETAELLRQRMRASRCLLFSSTEHASSSKWMPWELGFKDGQDKKSAILPVVARSTNSYRGQEYLGLYPYMTEDQSTAGESLLWIRRSQNCYVSFDEWLQGKEPYERS